MLRDKYFHGILRHGIDDPSSVSIGGQTLYRRLVRVHSKIVVIDTTLGVGLAIVAAISVAGTGLGIRLGNENGRTVDGLVVVLVCNLVLLTPITIFVHHPTYHVTLRSLGAFLAAGLTGTLLGRLCYFNGIASIGASRTEPIKATQPLHASIIAVLVLHETISGVHLGGILLIIGGVILITWQSSQDTTQLTTEGSATKGILFAFGAALFFGLEPIWVKLGLAAGTPVLVGLLLRVGVAALGFLGYLRLRSALPTRETLFSADTHWYVVAGVANTVFILTYYMALELAPVTIVVPIVQTSPLIVAVLSLLFLPQQLEKVDSSLFFGSLMVVSGAIIVTLAS